MTALNPGDLIRINTGKARFTVMSVKACPDGTTDVTAYGGKVGRMTTRTFKADQVVKCRVKRDPNQLVRLAIHDAAESSKKRKGRR